jgi:hypothetical protein
LRSFDGFVGQMLTHNVLDEFQEWHRRQVWVVFKNFFQFARHLERHIFRIWVMATLFVD